MYKYIDKKIESGYQFYVTELVLITFEVHRDEISELQESFKDLSPTEICEAFDWPINERNLKILTERLSQEDDLHDNLFMFFFNEGKKGFVARIHIPLCSDFKLTEDGSVRSWQVNPGRCRVHYTYADSIAELTEKSLELSEKCFQEELRIFRKLYPNA